VGTVLPTTERTDRRKTEPHAANIGLPQAGVKCLIEVLYFLFTFVLADRLVLLMPHLTASRGTLAVIVNVQALNARQKN